MLKKKKNHLQIQVLKKIHLKIQVFQENSPKIPKKFT